MTFSISAAGEFHGQAPVPEAERIVCPAVLPTTFCVTDLGHFRGEVISLEADARAPDPGEAVRLHGHHDRAKAISQRGGVPAEDFGPGILPAPPGLAAVTDQAAAIDLAAVIDLAVAAQAVVTGRAVDAQVADVPMVDDLMVGDLMVGDRDVRVTVQIDLGDRAEAIGAAIVPATVQTGTIGTGGEATGG